MPKKSKNSPHYSLLITHTKEGFTFIELLIVIAIISILVVLAIPFYQSFQVSSELGVVADELTRTLRRVEAMAKSGQNNSDWGIYFSEGQYILFKGNDFFSRDPEYDEIFDYPEIINITNDFSDQIYFNKFFGLPSVSSTITLVSANNEIKIITINGEGKVEME